MALATLSIDLEARLAKMQEGLDKATRLAEKSAEKIRHGFDGLADVGKSLGVALAGAFSVTAIENFFRTTIDGLDRLNDLKDSTGATIENISALEDVALRTGTSFEGMATTLVKFNKVLADADPDSEAARILKAFNLDAKELKALDPAEALRRTAVAMAQYAEDGDRARHVQVLFGKSVQEAGPFLEELAKQGKLNATVTREQAEEAEKFNKQLAALSKSATDLARDITGPLIAAMNKQIEKFKEGREAGKSYFDLFPSARDQWAALGNPFGAGKGDVDERAEQIDKLNTRIERLNKLLESGALTQERRLRLETQLAALEKQRDALFASSGADAGDFAALDVVKPRAKVPGKPEKKGRDPSLTPEQIARQWEQDAEEWSKTMLEISELTNKQQIAMGKERADAEKQQWKQVFEFIDAEQEQAIEDGKAFLEEKTKQLDTFFEQAARNIQDTLGDTVLQTLEGDFDSIGDLWGNLLKKMASQAIAAQLGKYLFGDFGSQVNGNTVTQIGGVFGSFLDLLPSFDVGTPYVPRDMLAKVHEGERIVTAADNRAGRWGGGGGGPGVVQHITITGGNRNEIMAAMVAAKDAAVGEVYDAARRGRLERFAA